MTAAVSGFAGCIGTVRNDGIKCIQKLAPRGYGWRNNAPSGGVFRPHRRRLRDVLARNNRRTCPLPGENPAVSIPIWNFHLNNRHSLTHKQKLRRDQPLWLAGSRTSVTTRKSPSARSYDVIIVGAGISGALMAHALSGAGLSVVIIDRRQPVRGSSAASTAMIQHEIDIPLHRLERQMGAEKAARVWRRSARAVEELASLVSDLDIRCSFERRRSLFLAGESYGARALREEVETRQRAGIEAEYLDRAALEARYGITSRTAAIVSAISASADPVKLTTGLLRHVRQRGVEIISDVEITDVREHSDAAFVATSRGQIISASKVVFSTGYEFLEGVANRKHSIISTWALASHPRLQRPAWLDEHLVWEGADPYLYFRSTRDGRVIVGGEDEDSEEAYKDPAKVEGKIKALTEKLRDLTGISIGKPDFAWSAAFGITPNGLPIIDHAPGMRNVFVTMGYGGNGITFSQIAASLISSVILRARDSDWDLFPAG